MQYTHTFTFTFSRRFYPKQLTYVRLTMYTHFTITLMAHCTSGSIRGFSALLKDTSTGNRTSNLLLTKRLLYLLYHCRPSVHTSTVYACRGTVAQVHMNTDLQPKIHSIATNTQTLTPHPIRTHTHNHTHTHTPPPIRTHTHTHTHTHTPFQGIPSSVEIHIQTNS